MPKQKLTDDSLRQLKIKNPTKMELEEVQALFQKARHVSPTTDEAIGNSLRAMRGILEKEIEENEAKQ